MRMYDIIEKKRDKHELNKEEIDFVVNEYSAGNIPDYQMSAFLMAVFLNKFTRNELVNFTLAMANSASRINLSGIREPGKYIVDKHSTGGVGDKITLIVLPIVASLGANVCKMSGRGLGFTGGTADKLESIQGYNIDIPIKKAIKQVQDIGVCLISQSEDVAIADKKIYALRDTTATIESIDLIAASIMSKKIASGADKIVLDVTVGSGAFMKDLESAKQLANTMVDIGELAGVETKAVITSMEQPLGRFVGNALEVKEVISFLLADEKTLMSDKFADVREVVLEISAYMLKMAGLGDDLAANKQLVINEILSKNAYYKFIELIQAQGGRTNQVYMDWIKETMPMPILKDQVKYLKDIYADRDGYILSIDSKKIGEALVALGGGRNKKDDQIDYAVGFKFKKKVGDKVKAGETIMSVLYNDKNKFNSAFEYIEDAIYVEDVEENVINKLKEKAHILGVVED